MQVPPQIDGADVVAYVELDPKAHHDTGSLRLYADGELQTHFHGLAIATYDLNDYYLFFCNAAWETENDTFHDSIVEAMQTARDKFCVAESQWTFLIEDLSPSRCDSPAEGEKRGD